MPSDNQTKKTASTTKRLMISSIFQIAFIIVIIIGGVTPTMFINGYSFYLVWFILYLILDAISITQIIAFRIPSKPKGLKVLL